MSRTASGQADHHVNTTMIAEKHLDAELCKRRFCMQECINLPDCVAFNFRSLSPCLCQLLTAPLGNPNPSEGWEFFKYQGFPY